MQAAGGLPVVSAVVLRVVVPEGPLPTAQAEAATVEFSLYSTYAYYTLLSCLAVHVRIIVCERVHIRVRVYVCRIVFVCIFVCAHGRAWRA